jgi:hypothetical protein
LLFSTEKAVYSESYENPTNSNDKKLMGKNAKRNFLYYCCSRTPMTIPRVPDTFPLAGDHEIFFVFLFLGAR